MTNMGSIARTTPATGLPEWRVSDGLTIYPDTLTLMRDRVAGIRAGTSDELVWLVEHPPVYTAGTSAAVRTDRSGPLPDIRGRPRRAVDIPRAPANAPSMSCST